MTMPRETGAIHDIGYRRYDGPASAGPTPSARSRCPACRRVRPRPEPRSKVMPVILVVVMVVPALIISAIVVISGSDDLPVAYTSWAVNLG